MPELLLPRGAASGGKRRSRGAAKSMASPQAASSRAQAPPSGRSRARSIERWASPRADRRSCAQRSARACAGDVAAWIGWAPRCWDMFCACTEWRDTPVWSPSIEVCSRDVFMSLRDLICELYIMCNTICEEISRTAIISWTRSHLSGTNFADMGPKATRSRTTTRDSLETLDTCCERKARSAVMAAIRRARVARSSEPSTMAWRIARSGKRGVLLARRKGVQSRAPGMREGPRVLCGRKETRGTRAQFSLGRQSTRGT